VHHLDSLRQGTASTKTRAEVRGSGRKLRQQKGTGKARIGDGQSPILRGGGVVFGPRPRDFSTKLPRKVLEMGMRVALSAKIREQSFGIVDQLRWNTISTKTLAARLHELGIQKTLFVTGAEDRNLQLSMENIPTVDVIHAEDLSVYEALRWQRLVLDVSAVEYFERTLAKPVPTITID
jgi:large subunit ribosomal protein L4